MGGMMAKKKEVKVDKAVAKKVDKIIKEVKMGMFGRPKGKQFGVESKSKNV